MEFLIRSKQFLRPVLLVLIALAPAAFAAPAEHAKVSIENAGNLGIIRGMVRDDGGTPIADATVAIFRAGTSKLFKQVSSASDGSFIAKIIPGTYTVLAVAQGFNPVTLLGVEVGRSAEVSYGFRLERSGSGNTLPEKRLDKNSSKWRIRAAQSQRSIYQHREGDSTVAVNTPDDPTDPSLDDDTTPSPDKKRGQTVIETYVADSPKGNFTGVNFATLVPVGDNADVVVAGQAGRGRNAPMRLETDLRFRAAASHEIRFNSSIARLGNITLANDDSSLGQVSFQAMDEWKLRDGVILVLGLDYSRFLGVGRDASITPRLGLQFDVNSKTRMSVAYTTQTANEKNWANSIDLEGQSIAFSDPISVQDLYIVKGKPRMNKSRRFEFGVERILDNKSSVEANAFFDTTFGRGVGLNKFGFDTLDGSGFSEFVANQQGQATGIRFVYNRRVNGILSTSAGYAFGNGQKLSQAALHNPSDVFESDFFQSFFAQLAADLKTGTSIKTIFRLSPDATVFAIDPFKGRLAIYDPGLSVFVTQTLPTFGLPIRAQAIIDARNVFDFQTGVSCEEGSLRFSAQHRIVRGGIQVRF